CLQSQQIGALGGRISDTLLLDRLIGRRAYRASHTSREVGWTKNPIRFEAFPSPFELNERVPFALGFFLWEKCHDAHRKNQCRPVLLPELLPMMSHMADKSIFFELMAQGNEAASIFQLLRPW